MSAVRFFVRDIDGNADLWYHRSCRPDLKGERHMIAKLTHVGSGYMLTDRAPLCVVVVEIQLEHRFVVNIGLGE